MEALYLQLKTRVASNGNLMDDVAAVAKSKFEKDMQARAEEVQAGSDCEWMQCLPGPVNQRSDDISNLLGIFFATGPARSKKCNLCQDGKLGFPELFAAYSAGRPWHAAEDISFSQAERRHVQRFGSSFCTAGTEVMCPSFKSAEHKAGVGSGTKRCSF